MPISGLGTFSPVKLNTAIKITMGGLQGPRFFKEVKFCLLGYSPILLGIKENSNYDLLSLY